MDAVELFEDSLTWLRVNYRSYRFFMERDIVWTLQLHLRDLIRLHAADYRVFHNHRIVERQNADLAILKADNSVEVAAEFKYEPAHNRKTVDIGPGKLDVVFWKEGVVADVERTRRFVAEGRAATAYAILIDEGGHFRWREPPHESQWIDWGGGVFVLWTRFGVGAPTPLADRTSRKPLA